VGKQVHFRKKKFEAGIFPKEKIRSGTYVAKKSHSGGHKNYKKNICNCPLTRTNCTTIYDKVPLPPRDNIKRLPTSSI
jgi:hypothetical protein